MTVFLMLAAMAMGPLMLQRSASASEVNVGFFSGRSLPGNMTSFAPASCGNRWHRVFCEGIPDYSGNKSGFINHIKNELSKGPNSQNGLGAAFIIYTMLGRESSSNRAVSATDLAEWERRINNDAIQIVAKRLDVYPNSVYTRFADGVYDNAFVDDWSGVNDMMAFQYNGADVYYLKLSCANPVGDMPGIPEVPSWTASGHSEISKNGGSWTTSQINDGRPGETINWRHNLTNNSNTDMNRDVQWYINPFTNGAIQPSVEGGTGRGNAWNTFVTRNTSYVIRPDDVGSTLCQDISWNPMTHSNGAWGHSNQACVYVPYNYSLIPSIIAPDSIPEGESSIPEGSVIPKIENPSSSGGTRSKEAKYAVIRFVVRDETTPVNDGAGVRATGSNWPCVVASGITAASESCGVLERNDGPVVINSGGSVNPVIGNDDISSLNLRLGDRLCYATMVSSYDPSVDSDTFRYAVKCVRLAKSPKVQFWGGDVRSGDDVITRTVRRGGNTYGSWAEYGIFSTGEARSASGAGLSGRDGRTGTLNTSRLTFANTPSLGRYGIVPQTTLPSMFINSNGASVAGTRSVADLAAGDSLVEWTVSGDLVIDAGEVPLGKTILVKATGTVTINGNIHYAGGGVADTTQIPQMVIAAENIVINSGVTQVDAWLVARGGYVSTCERITGGWLDGLSATICNQPLRINGPVIADNLYLRRTGGSDLTDPNYAAEIMNLRPDAYLWAYGQAKNATTIRTMHLKELPPRF